MEAAKSIDKTDTSQSLANHCMTKVCIVHSGEIILKGRNRSHFQRMLISNIHKSIEKIAACRVRNYLGRIFIEFGSEVPLSLIRTPLQKIFGVANFAPCHITEPSFDKLKEALGLQLRKDFGQTRNISFAIKAHRIDKQFPVSSSWMNKELGAFVQNQTGWSVDLSNPDLKIHILMSPEKILYFFHKIPGAGGLPSGMSGHTCTLLSGGIDSPVAAYRILKRGLTTTFLHFHSIPFTSEESVDKVWSLAEKICEYSAGSKLVLIPFGDIQRTIIANTQESFRVLLYRRLMMRIACRLARQEKAKALVTGEALGQVASQTLGNLRNIESASDLPILRPLIGMDKEEIMQEARKIETYDISIRPHQDCCSFMVPKHPATNAPLTLLERAESNLDIEELVTQGVEKAQRHLVG